MAKVRFEIIEILRIMRILNLYPTTTKHQWNLITKLTDVVELTKEEKVDIGWTETPIGDDGMNTRLHWTQDAGVLRKFTTQERKRILVYIENPPKAIPWLHTEARLRTSIIGKLGGDTGEDDE